MSKVISFLAIIIATLLFKWLYWILAHLTSSVSPHTKCLSGYMTDVQDWVTKDGTLKERQGRYSIDLSGEEDAVTQLQRMMAEMTRGTRVVSTLSLAKCGLTAVPQVFSLRDPSGRSLADSLEYLTLYGNNFYQSSEPELLYEVKFNATGAVEYVPYGKHRDIDRWETGLQNCGTFQSLKDLDLRSCSIRTLQNNTFRNIPKLEALYLGENYIIHIEANAFYGLSDLIHLDLSNNHFQSPLGTADSVQIDSVDIFNPLKKLGSLDFSNTRLTQTNAFIFGNVPDSLQRLSICNSGINSLGSTFFSKTNLKYLDVSGNSQILSIEYQKFIENLCKSLVVLYADRTGLQTLNSFKDFGKLEILKISNNAVSSIPVHVASTWKKLKVLDLTANRMPSWFGPNFKLMPELKFLSLVRNNLYLLSEAMIKDLKDVHYVGLSDNYFVCSCHVREFIEAAIKAENRSMHSGLLNDTSDLGNSQTTKVRTYNENMYPRITPSNGNYRPRAEFTSSDENGLEISAGKSMPNEESEVIHTSLSFHTGYTDFESSIFNRVPATRACDEHNCLAESIFNTSYLIFDYDNNAYRCHIVNDDIRKEFIEVEPCDSIDRSLPYERVIEEQIVLIIVMVCVPLTVFAVVAIVLFRRWWCIKYFCITVKNSAMLSILSNEETNIGTGDIFHYDVFVSYCNEDRAWVLEELLPQVETSTNVSVCLHERDFQVGLSILENIVSCMDRSRAILLVISTKFLLSQWCQFEMHLAQHRLLETRREDLILVLLEDIPRRRRPHTLHYLMMTKTYIVWPRSVAEQEGFWRRVNKSLANKTALREPVTDA